MIGRTISHYRILEKLGEGGMGVVYKAQDTKLDRTVALKFLPPHMLADKGAEKRFISEAKAASSLEHNNICAIHEIDETNDGQLFIAMSYLEGKTLREKIDAAPLKVDEAISIALQTAEGLKLAHEKDIVHRDVKPANIMVTTNGTVKIMDFGLAKLGNKTKLTQMGTTLGTFSYMSPEQSRGEEVDRRTDIWSLGVVMYEMLTGQLPFKGDYEQAVIYSIINESPEPLTAIRTGVPMELERITNKLLAKNINERYQSMTDVLVDLQTLRKKSITAESSSVSKEATQIKRKLPLKWLISSAVLIVVVLSLLFTKPWNSSHYPIQSIAVVDFVNETDEKELNSLSGLLITALEQSRQLSVLTRSRMFDILNQLGEKDVDNINEKMGMEICKHANIEALAVASIRKLGNRYAIDLKILNPQKNTYLLAAKEEDNGPENIFAMIDRLAEKTRKGLNEKAEEIQAARQKVADVTTTNLEAYEHYFQGEQFINQLKIKEAIEEFKKAVAIDSTFAQAYYRLAYAESWERGNEVIKKKHLDHALKHINRMPEKEQYLVRATNAIIDNNYKTGVAILKEMEQIYPDDKEMIYNIGDWSFHLNDDTTAVAYLEKTLQIDPNHQRALQHLTLTYRDMGNYNKMLETAQRYVAVSSSAESYQLLVDAFNQLGQLEQGISTLKQARDLFPDNSLLQGEIAKIYAYQGKYEEAEKYLKSMTGEEKTNSSRKQGYLVLGDLYAYLGKYILSMNMYDNLIELYRQENNMHMVAEYGIFKAYWMMWGRGKKDGVLEEVEKTMEVKNPGCFAYNLTLALIYIDFKYFDKAYAASEEYVNANYQHSVKAQEHFNKEEWENAINEFKNFGNLDANPIARYKIAQCYFELGKWQKAIEETKAVQNLYSGFGWWVTYPKTFYLLGKIYEKNGDVNPAIKNYEKFLELWKNADEDLPDLIDGKKRLAKLKDV